MSLLKVLYGLQCVYPRDRGLFDAYPNDAQTSIRFIANTQLSVFQKSSISDRVRYNLPEIGKKIAYKANRTGVAERFPDPAVQKSIAVDLAMIDSYDRLLTDLELDIGQTAKQHDANTLYRLQTRV